MKQQRFSQLEEVGRIPGRYTSVNDQDDFATLVFAITKDTTTPESFSNRRYPTAPNPRSDASAKTCKSRRFQAPGPLLERLILSGGRFSIEDTQEFYLFKMTGGKSSSHSRLFCHTSWMIVFATKVTGTKIPSGPKIPERIHRS